MKICKLCQRCYEDPVLSCVKEDHGALAAARSGSREIVGKYRLERLIESDLTGDTFAAAELGSNNASTIKLIRLDQIGNASAVRERLNREAKAAMSLDHPNVTRVDDYGEIGETEFYVATEASGGDSLREYLWNAGSLSEATAATVARATAEGLEAAHRVGVIHRSLSPANITLTANGENGLSVKIRNFDFGSVKQQIVTASQSNDAAVLDALRYLSPEQCAGREADARADVYSLGIVLYEMLSGQSPFDALTAADLVRQQINEQPLPLRQLQYDVKALLMHALSLALEKNPTARTNTAGAFARHLRHIEQLAAQSPLSRAQTPPPLPTKQSSVDKATDHALVNNTVLPESNVLSVNGAQQTPVMTNSAKTGEPVNSVVVPLFDQSISSDGGLNNAFLESESRDAANRNQESAAQPISFEKKAVVPVTTQLIAVEKDVAAVPLAAQCVPPRNEAANVAPPAVEQTFVATKPRVNRPAVQPVAVSPTNAAHAAKRAAYSRRAGLIGLGLALLLAVAVIGALLSLNRQSEQPVAQNAAAPNPTAETPTNAAQPSTRPNAPSDEATAAVAPAAPEDAAAPPTTVAEPSRPTVAKRNAPDTLRREVSGDEATKPNQTGEENTNAGNVPPTIAKNNARPESRGASPDKTTEAELNSSLNTWITATNARDINSQMNFYAPTVNSYYRARNVSPEAVRAEKRRVFERADTVDIQTGKPNIVVSPDGRSATMRFNKKYQIKDKQRNRSGEVVQELKWTKSDKGWKIVSERDIKVVNR